MKSNLHIEITCVAEINMEEDAVVPEANPEITRIFEIMDALLLEVRVDGSYVRIPKELRPSKTEISLKEACDIIEESINNIREQLRMHVSQLAELDPIFFTARLAIFLEEWPKRHPGENLIFFWTYKFLIEAQADFIAPD